MKKTRHLRWLIPLLCGAAVLAGAGVYWWKRPLSFDLGEVTSATVRYGNNGDEVILNGEDLGLLLEDIGRNRFARHSYAGMRGGWSYYIILYSDDECLTDFLVMGEDKIQYGDFYYTASPGLDNAFLDSLFTRNQEDAP